jgi:hypothetical protein
LTDVAGRGWRRVPGDAFPPVRGDRLPAPELDYMSA